MLEDAIELLTNQLIDEDFKEKETKKESKIVMTKLELYRFCIKLVKLLKRVEDM